VQHHSYSTSSNVRATATANSAGTNQGGLFLAALLVGAVVIGVGAAVDAACPSVPTHSKRKRPMQVSKGICLVPCLASIGRADAPAQDLI
jgi:hypothetical protein